MTSNYEQLISMINTNNTTTIASPAIDEGLSLADRRGDKVLAVGNGINNSVAPVLEAVEMAWMSGPAVRAAARVRSRERFAAATLAVINRK